MSLTDQQLSHIKAIIEHAKISPIFRDRYFFDYICAIMNEELTGKDYTFEIMEKDNQLMSRVEKRINIVTTICENLSSFDNEDIKKYILDSIKTEMWLSFNIGRFGNVD